MRQIILFILLPICLLCSCGVLVRPIYGIKKPGIENPVSLKEYMAKLGLDSSGEQNYIINRKKYHNTVRLINKRLPDILIFDRQGRNIIYREAGTCSAGASLFIDSLKKKRTYPVNDSLTQKMFESNLYSLEGNKINLNLADSVYDYTLCIFWAKWLGRLNKNKTKTWELKAKGNTGTKIRVIKINCDAQECWYNSSKPNNKAN